MQHSQISLYTSILALRERIGIFRLAHNEYILRFEFLLTLIVIETWA